MTRCHSAAAIAPSSTLMIEPTWRRTIASFNFAESSAIRPRVCFAAVTTEMLICVICPIFSSSVMRERRDATRALAAAVGACAKVLEVRPTVVAMQASPSKKKRVTDGCSARHPAGDKVE